MEPTAYQICVRGQLSERFGSALDGMLLQTGSAMTTFTGEVRDQSQLYGLLQRVSDLGLELVSVQPYRGADASAVRRAYPAYE